MVMTDEIMEAAIDYARRGWRVVPTSSKAKHPPFDDWQIIATTDLEQLEQLFTEGQRRGCDGVSVVLGKTSGIIDIETDSPEGEQQFVKLFDDDLLITARFRSGSGRGSHYLFRYREDLPDKAHMNHPGGLHIDFKLGTNDRGTQSVFPPSAHKQGQYRWLAHPDDVGIADLPDHVLTRIVGLTGADKASGNGKPRSDRQRLYQHEFVTEGSRDSTLYAEACGLWREQFRMYGNGCFDSDKSRNVVLERLWAWNRAKCLPPLDDELVVAKCDNAREFIRRETGGRSQHSSGPNAADAKRGPRPLTDLGNAERLVEQHGQKVRYVGPWEKWLVWTGRRWKLDTTKSIQRLAKRTVRSIYAEAAALAKQSDTDPKTIQELTAWAKASEKRERIAALIALASSEEGIAIDHDVLDRDPWLLNCRNGTVDLRTGELRPHNPDDLITKITGTEFPTGPGEDAVLWCKVLHTIFAGDRDLIAFVQKLFGLAIVGAVYEHILPIFWGSGANGKSVVIETAMAALGEYAMKAPRGLLLAKRQEAHPTEIADLHGRRLVAIVETGDGQRFDEALVKETTGGDSLRARRMREDFWQFVPTHLAILVSNHKPAVRGTDHGIWRRLRLVPFTVTIPEDQQDKRLTEKLRAEWPAILRWMVDGCLAWQRDGLTPPEKVLAATDSYREESDTFKHWLAERCEIDSKAEVKSNVAYANYKGWCEEAGEHFLSRVKFAAKVEEAGFKRLPRRRDGIFYSGFRLFFSHV